MRTYGTVLAVLCLLGSMNLFAQTSNATLGGTVADVSGAAIPGVTVTARNEGTGIVNETITNETGTYQFANLQTGTYEVRAELPGFQTQRITNVERNLSDTGSVQVVSGGGDIRQFDAKKNPPAWNLVHKKINHYVQVEVSADAMQFTAVDVKGDTFDVWRLPLKGQPREVTK